MKLGIIGYGNMGSAFARALRDQCELMVYDINPDRLKAAKEDGVACASDLYFLLKESDHLMIAVKPKDIPGVLAEIRENMGEKIIISIAAGVEIASIKEMAGGHQRVIRMMPNLGVEVGKGVIAVSYAEGVGDDEREKIKEVFSALGRLYEIPEGMFDSFTAIAGSGPAFVLSFIDAMALAGVREGFPYPLALEIVMETVSGTVELLKNKAVNPDDLVKKVASPGGTTIEGLAYLERKGFKGTVIRCVEKTSEKAKRIKS